MNLTKELIDKIVHEISPTHPYPIDEEKRHCEYSLMKDRDRIRTALLALIEGHGDDEI